jgi:hypothetical protein
MRKSTMSKKPKRNWREIIKDYNEDALFIGEPSETCYDEAIIGIGQQHGRPSVLIYSYTLLVHAFAKRFMEDRKHLPAKERAEMQDPWEAAAEWVDVNVVCAYMGENTPIVAHVSEHDE